MSETTSSNGTADRWTNMATKKVVIHITDTPTEAAAIALELRRHLLNCTPALVRDNCACGNLEQPRRIEATFLGEWRQGVKSD